jgi:pimeloyl-ACP methyl ester carboxylesterase
MHPREVISPDGLALAAYEGGNSTGPEILFIHGFSQCAACWEGQFADPQLSRRFRLAAFDLRGHGASDKPADPARYAEDRFFADDVQAVMDALGLKRPVVVGWSYAGRVIGDYVRTHGTRRLAGINYVCARTNNDPRFNGPDTSLLAPMIGNDAAAEMAATRDFVRACFHRSPGEKLLQRVVDYNMLLSPAIRAAHLRRPPDDGAILRRIDVPVLVTQGVEDQIVLRGLADLTASAIPGARLSLYDGAGHTPFVEDAARFNRELADFAAAAHERPR